MYLLPLHLAFYWLEEFANSTQTLKNDEDCRGFYTVKNLRILGFFYQTFLILERTFADKGFICAVQRKDFLSLEEGNVFLLMQRVICLRQGDVIFPESCDPGKLPEDSWLATGNSRLRTCTEKTKYRNFETNIPRKGISGSQSQSPHSCVCE